MGKREKEEFVMVRERGEKTNEYSVAEKTVAFSLSKDLWRDEKERLLSSFREEKEKTNI